MFTIRISKLSTRALSGAFLLISACLVMSATPSPAQTATGQDDNREQSEKLRREGREIFGKWQQTRDSTYLHEAIECYRKAVQADTLYYLAYEYLSYPLSDIGDREAAIAACEKSADLLGENKSGVLAWLGYLYFHDGQREKALEAFKKQILLDPFDGALYGDTKIYLERGDFTTEEMEAVLSLYGPLRIEKPEVLERSVARYKSLKGYRDTTVVQMRMVRPGMENQFDVPFLFAYQRPNRLRIESRNAPLGMGAALFIDGANLVQFNETWKQYTRKDAPDTISASILQGQTVGPAEGAFVPRILLSDEPLKTLLDGVERATEVGREDLDGVPVTVVELTKRAGSLPGSNSMFKKDAPVGLRLWIGSRDFLIRKMSYELDMGQMANENMPQQQRAMLAGMKMSFDLRHTAIETDPAFSGKDFTFTPGEGREVKLADFAGKVVILDFWATWCPPCVKEIPEFVELYEAYKDQGLVIIGISLDKGGVELVKNFAAKNKVAYPLLMADQKVTQEYGGISGIPTTFIIDRQGKLVDGVVGDRPKAYFEGKISSLF